MRRKCCLMVLAVICLFGMVMPAALMEGNSNDGGTMTVVDMSATSSVTAASGEQLEIVVPSRSMSFEIRSSENAIASLDDYWISGGMIHFTIKALSEGVSVITVETDDTTYTISVKVGQKDHKLYPMSGKGISRSLTRIESEAFANTDLKVLRLSDNVEYIAEDALDGSSIDTIYAPRGSMAWNWAVQHGFVYTERNEMDDFIIRDGVIIGYNGVGGDVVIPARDKDGNSVTRIDDYVFYSNAYITNVVIPEGITGIGNAAFCDCENLENATIPDSVTVIEFSAFKNCHNLTDLVIPNGTETIESHAFENCSSLTSLEIPASVSEIGNYAFSDCSSLESVNFIDCGAHIGEGAFSNCSSLKNVELSEGISTIESWTFFGCDSLESISVPASVQSIDAMALPGKDDLVIHGQSGSYAQTYAEENGRTFEPIQAPATGRLAGLILSAEDRKTPVTLAKIWLYDGNDPTKKLFENFAYPDNNGEYGFLNLPVGKIKVVVECEGYIDFSAYVTIRENERTYLPTFLMIKGTEGQTGTASGRIMDAVTGAGLAGTDVNIKEGWDNPDKGEFVASVKTDSQGNYKVELPIGNYTAVCSALGYPISSFNLIVLANTETGNQDHYIAVHANEDQYRVVLTWGANPKDLDLHVQGYRSDASQYTVFYSNKVATDNGEIICILDHDDTHGNGRETVLMTPQMAQPHYFYVYLFTGSGTLPTSGARVEIYKGSSHVRTIDVPTVKDTDKRYWNVFSIENGRIIARNTFTDSPETDYTLIEGQVRGTLESPKYLAVGQQYIPDVVFDDGWRYNYSIEGETTNKGVKIQKVGSSGLGKDWVVPISLGKTEMTWHCRTSLYGHTTDFEPFDISQTIYTVYSVPNTEIIMGYNDTFEVKPIQYAFLAWEDKGGNDFNDVQWISDTPNVVTVTGASGTTHAQLKGVSLGEGTVRMRHMATGAELKLDVKVVKPPENISLNETTLIMAQDDSPRKIGEAPIYINLNGSVWNNFGFASDNPDVAEVSEDGLITPKAIGIANIIVKAGNARAFLNVHVVEPPTKVCFSDGSTTKSIKMLKGMKFEVPDRVLQPKTSGGRLTVTSPDGIDYHSGNDKLYDQKGGTISANKTGTFTVTFTSSNGKSANLKIEVIENDVFWNLMSTWSKYNEAGESLTNILGVKNEKSFWKELMEKLFDNFDETKKEELKEKAYAFDGIQLGTSYYGIDKKELEEDIKLAFSTRIATSAMLNLDFKGLEWQNGAKFIESIFKMIRGNQTESFTFKGGKTEKTITYIPNLSLGEGTFVAGFEIGKIRIENDPHEYDITLTNTTAAGVDAFMKQLKEIANAKIEEALKASIQGALNDLGVDKVFKLVKQLNSQSGIKKQLIISALEKMTGSLPGRITKFLSAESDNKPLLGSICEAIGSWDENWKVIKGVAGDNWDIIAKAINTKTNTMSESDMNDLIGALKKMEEENKTIKDTIVAAKSNPEAILKLLNKVK